MAELEEVQDGPCEPWPINPLCCPDWPEDPQEWDEQHVEAASIATDILWRMTAGRYGLCAQKIRPCRKGCTPDGHGTGFLWGNASWILSPYQDDKGRWFNVGCACGTDCSCGPVCAIELPGPVHAVVDVRIDGEELPCSAYALDRRPGKGKAELIRVDGGECWPTCQDMTKPDTEPDTFSVTYLRGKPVPAAGVRAVSVLACDLYKQCSGKADGCRLPLGVRTVQREGVTYEIMPPGDWMETFQNHMPEVYRWLELVNPHKLKQPTAVFSLDLPGQRPFTERGNLA